MSEKTMANIRRKWKGKRRNRRWRRRRRRKWNDQEDRQPIDDPFHPARGYGYYKDVMVGTIMVLPWPKPGTDRLTHAQIILLMSNYSPTKINYIGGVYEFVARARPMENGNGMNWYGMEWVQLWWWWNEWKRKLRMIAFISRFLKKQWGLCLWIYLRAFAEKKDTRSTQLMDVCLGIKCCEEKCARWI